MTRNVRKSGIEEEGIKRGVEEGHRVGEGIKKGVEQGQHTPEVIDHKAHDAFSNSNLEWNSKARAVRYCKITMRSDCQCK